MNRVEVFNEHRGLLLSIAYRMLGTRADAEDIVQDAFLRWQNASPAEIQSPKSYLATIVTRLSIDQLRSARVQREVYVGAWLPEPIPTSRSEDTSMPALSESLTMAFLVLLESLTPTERAAFLLHEVFDYEYSEVSEIIGKSETNCRQLIHRAKERIAARKRRFPATHEESVRITRTFVDFAARGDVEGLMSLLAEDAVVTSDGGGKARAALNPIHGAANAARFFAGVAKKAQADVSWAWEEYNGQPAMIAYAGGVVVWVAIFDIDDGRIQKMFLVVNPDKLTRVGQSPWGVPPDQSVQPD